MENIELKKDKKMSSVGVLTKDRKEFIKLKIDYETKNKKNVSQVEFFALLLEIYRNNGGEI